MKKKEVYQSQTRSTFRDRRKHPRFSIVTDASLRKCPHCLGMGPLIDISMGGVSFHYENGDKDLDFPSIDIYFGNDIFVLEKIPCQKIIVPRHPEAEEPRGNKIVRRVGVQFGPLTPQLKTQLTYLLQLNSLLTIEAYAQA